MINNINNFIKNNLLIILFILFLIFLYLKFQLDKIEHFAGSSSPPVSTAGLDVFPALDDLVRKTIESKYKLSFAGIRKLTDHIIDLTTNSNYIYDGVYEVTNTAKIGNKFNIDISGNINTTGIIYTNNFNNLPTSWISSSASSSASSPSLWGGLRTNNVYSDGTISIGNNNYDKSIKINNDGSVSFANNKVNITKEGVLNVEKKIKFGNTYFELVGDDLYIKNSAGNCIIFKNDTNVQFYNGFVTNMIFQNDRVIIRTAMDSDAGRALYAKNEYSHDCPGANQNSQWCRDNYRGTKAFFWGDRNVASTHVISKDGQDVRISYFQ